MAPSSRNIVLILLLCLFLFSYKAHAFGAGNIASISAVEGKNWRHGDIEDVLKTIACIKHHKWNSMMIKRVYFGNWLRDYSQAMDTGALKKAQPETIRILVWLLSFLGFGYATAEFEVTSERLGVYRPEEHIDNPKDYNDNEDARKFDARLRAPVRDIELQIDPETGMKNYIANGKGDWATSAAFVKYSFERSIHHGRLYTNGHGLFKGKDEDLAEALRCLGQGLHTLEDFGAHTNYVELSMKELGFRNVFAHVGTNAGINLRGKHVEPLVTGTFGMVDFYHSVLGEATDHFTQSEVNEMDNALGTAQQAANSSNPLFTLTKLLAKVPGTRDLCEEAEQLQAASNAQARSLGQDDYSFQGGARGVDDYNSSSRGVDDWETSRASQANFPGQNQSYDTNAYNQPQTGYQQQHWDQSQGQYQQQPAHYQQGQYQQQWHDQGQSQHQTWQDPSVGQNYNSQDQYSGSQHSWQQPPASQQWATHPQQQTQQPMQSSTTAAVPHPANNSGGPATSALEGMPNFDPAKTIKQIYPILVFRDKVVRTISSIIEKIPGLEALVDRITETLTVFILSLLAPFVRPIINGISKALQTGSEGVLDSSAKHQFEVWTNPNSSDPTHSMLSKDHFSNLLNEPAGNVAAEILKYIAPRVLYAWEHPDVPVDQVMRDVEQIFHHPAIRDENNECHRNMFNAVRRWVDASDRGRLEAALSSESVKQGKNHKAGVNPHMQQHKPPSNQQSSGGLSGLASFIPGGGQQHGGSGQSGGFGGLANFLPGSHQQQQHGGGGHSNNPLGMVGDLVGNFTGHNKPGQQQHGGGGSNPLGMVGDLVSSFSGHKPAQGHGGGGGGGGGLNSMMGMASHLPIPGMKEYNKYSKFFPGGGARGLDDEDLGPGGDVGGGQELREAEAHAERYGDMRSPSPMPMQPPPGYEQYGRQEPGGYFAGQDQYQYQSGYQDPYNQSQQQGQGYGGGGGESGGYYSGR